MFYSQIILQKKGPLGKVWLAAHWGDAKLKRPQIFSTDISASVDCIVHPQVPLALRVSGHLLLGVVRIYSRKVKYLMNDASEAMVKIKLAFKNDKTSSIDLQTGAVTTTTGAGGGAGGNTANNRQSGAGGGGGNDLDVAHFGEYLVVDAAGRHAAGAGAGAGAAHAFEIPFDLAANDNDDDWVPAELEDDDDAEFDAAGGTAGGQDTLQAMMYLTQRTNTQDDNTQEDSRRGGRGDDRDLTLDTDLSASLDTTAMGGGRGVRRTRDNDDDEGWTAFDPDDDEEEDGQHSKKTDESHVSDIEQARAANDSLMSDGDRLRRASSLEKDMDYDSTGAPISPVAGGRPEDDDDDAMMPFADDDEDEVPPPPADDDSANARLSVPAGGRDTDSQSGGGASIGGLDVSTDTPHTATLKDRSGTAAAAGAAESEEEGTDDDEGNKKRKRAAATRRKRRKLRKVVIDNDATELTKAHIKHMIANTDDIVRQPVHPATWVPGMSTSTGAAVSDEDLLREYVGYERLLSRPALGDDGQLHPTLLALWARNAAPVLGKPFAYKLRAGVSAAHPEAEEEEADVEQARQDQGSVGTDGQKREASVGGEHQMDDDDGNFPPADDEDDNFPPPMDDEDDAPMPDDDDDDAAAAAAGQHPMDDSGFATDMAGMDKSPISLGLVNDFGEDLVEEEEEDEEDARQAPGDELVSSHSKWHKHTVKVLTMLQSNLSSAADESSDKPHQLSYNKISQGVSRRTAAGVFFELLQLKTWDFIELNQDESFGDITISAGVKFDESPPSS